MSNFDDLLDGMMNDISRIAGVRDQDKHKERAAFGLLETLSKTGRKEDTVSQKKYKKESVEEYVPPKMQGTPAEALIMELGGGTSNRDLGLPSGSNGTPVVNVPEVDNIFEETSSDQLKDIKRTISTLASFFGGKVIWK